MHKEEEKKAYWNAEQPLYLNSKWSLFEVLPHRTVPSCWIFGVSRLFKVDFPGPIIVYSHQKYIKYNNFEILPKTEDPLIIQFNVM